MQRPALLLAATFFSIIITTAQTSDTLYLANGDDVVGEIKDMSNGIVTVETSYSDSDFRIEWDQVVEVRSSVNYLFNLADGTRINGTIRPDPADNTKVLVGMPGNQISVNPIDIVYIKSVKSNFLSRLDLLLEIGFNVTKANNLRQFSTRTAAGYTANTWSANASINSVVSNQDSVAATKRMDASVGVQWFLKNDWFVSLASTFLSNDEQKLQLRATPQLGIGHYFVRNNKLYFAGIAGLAYNSEKFQTDEPNRNSLEAFITADLNLFDIGDLSLLSSVTAYPSLTESGRFRSDMRFDAKYDFFDDFYLKMGVTFNYDNEPTVGASTTDYVFQFTVGWEL